MVFTEKGKCFWMRVFEIPEGSKTSKGRAIQYLINIAQDDKIYALSLHDALPIFGSPTGAGRLPPGRRDRPALLVGLRRLGCERHLRSEEHTSELQSRRDLVCRLLLEKKKIT